MALLSVSCSVDGSSRSLTGGIIRLLGIQMTFFGIDKDTALTMSLHSLTKPAHVLSAS